MKLAEEYIIRQSDHNQAIILHLCAVIEKVVPELVLLFKWKLPFYYYKKKPFCFINSIKKGSQIDLCFMNGHLLKNHTDILISENRKIVTSLRYSNLEDIDNKIVKEVLMEATGLF
jgi:hypothetical protein